MHTDHNYCAEKEFLWLKHFCLPLPTHFLHSKKLTNKKQKFSLKSKRIYGWAIPKSFLFFGENFLLLVLLRLGNIFYMYRACTCWYTVWESAVTCGAASSHCESHCVSLTSSQSHRQLSFLCNCLLTLFPPSWMGARLIT